MSDNNGTVLVEILQGTQVSGGCNCSGCHAVSSCGSAVDYAEESKKLSEELKASYGDKVEVKYVDTDKTGLDEYPILRRVMQMGYPFPVTLINGEPKFAGGIMEKEIRTIIDDMIKESSN